MRTRRKQAREERRADKPSRLVSTHLGEYRAQPATLPLPSTVHGAAAEVRSFFLRQTPRPHLLLGRCTPPLSRADSSRDTQAVRPHVGRRVAHGHVSSPRLPPLGLTRTASFLAREPGSLSANWTPARSCDVDPRTGAPRTWRKERWLHAASTVPAAAVSPRCADGIVVSARARACERGLAAGATRRACAPNGAVSDMTAPRPMSAAAVLE